MVDRKILYLGLIILTIILIIFYRNRIVKSYENFVCAIDTTAKTHLDEYYNRCINEYKYKESSVPKTTDDNSSRELVAFYLNQNDKIRDHDKYSQFGKIPGTNRGWTNQINKQSIMPEWAYYLFKIQTNKYSLPDLDNDDNYKESKNYYNNIFPSKMYLNDYNQDRFKSNTYEERIHNELLSIFLYRIQTAKKTENPNVEVDLIWGIPYLKIKDGPNKYKSLSNTENVPNFNYCYQILFKGKNNKDDRYLCVDSEDESKLSITSKDKINVSNSYFELINVVDCNQYLKVKKHNTDKYIRTDKDSGLKLGGDDGINTRIIVSPKEEVGDLGVDIDTVFIPNTNPLTSTGNATNVFFSSGVESNSNNWLALLGINKEGVVSVLNKEYAVISKNDVSTDGQVDENMSIPIIYTEKGEPDRKTDIESFIDTYEGIAFIRTNKLIKEDQYAYQEIRQAKPIGTSGDGIVQDVGLLKVIDKENPRNGFLNSGDKVSTNQKIFPIVDNDEVINNDSNTLHTQCEYTGLLTDKDDIKSICNANPKCYGIYKESENNQLMGYVGPSCRNRDFKYFDKYSNNPDIRIHRGKVNCGNIGEDVDDTEDGKDIKICSLPRYNTKETDNSLVSLQPSKKFSDPNYCQINLDYGRLDSGDEYSMFVNNPSCNGMYEMEGAPLNSVNNSCNIDEKCIFNKFSKEDEAFLLNSDFGKLINQNIELKRKLNSLSNKVNNFKTELENKNNNIENNNKELSGQLNDFKIIKMNDVLNNFNYHAVNELADTHN